MKPPGPASSKDHPKPRNKAVVRLALMAVLVVGFALTAKWIISLIRGNEPYLEHFHPNGKYYLRQPGDNDTGGGIFDGTVERLYVEGDEIIAEVDRLFDGDPNGLYRYNFKTRTVSGPLNAGSEKDHRSRLLPPSSVDLRISETY